MPIDRRSKKRAGADCMELHFKKMRRSVSDIQPLSPVLVQSMRVLHESWEMLYSSDSQLDYEMYAALNELIEFISRVVHQVLGSFKKDEVSELISKQHTLCSLLFPFEESTIIQRHSVWATKYDDEDGFVGFNFFFGMLQTLASESLTMMQRYPIHSSLGCATIIRIQRFLDCQDIEMDVKATWEQLRCGVFLCFKSFNCDLGQDLFSREMTQLYRLLHSSSTSGQTMTLLAASTDKWLNFSPRNELLTLLRTMKQCHSESSTDPMISEELIQMCIDSLSAHSSPDDSSDWCLDEYLVLNFARCNRTDNQVFSSIADAQTQFEQQLDLYCSRSITSENFSPKEWVLSFNRNFSCCISAEAVFRRPCESVRDVGDILNPATQTTSIAVSVRHINGGVQWDNFRSNIRTLISKYLQLSYYEETACRWWLAVENTQLSSGSEFTRVSRLFRHLYPFIDYVVAPCPDFGLEHGQLGSNILKLMLQKLFGNEQLIDAMCDYVAYCTEHQFAK